MTLKRALIGALVIVLLLAGGVLVYWQFFGQGAAGAAEAEAAATPLPVEPVVSGDGAISAEGQLVPLRQAALATAFPATQITTDPRLGQGHAGLAQGYLLRPRLGLGQGQFDLSGVDA